MLQMFWSSIIKQMAGRNVAIRHAMASLGSIHELNSQSTSPRSKQLSILAYDQYHKAVRRLEETSITRDPRLIRVVCLVLFITIELKLGVFRRAHSLLVTALEMLNASTADEEVFETLTERRMTDECILPMLIHFRLQVTVPAVESMEQSNSLWYVRPVLPNLDDTPFLTIDCARDALGSILRSTFSAIHHYASNADTSALESMIETGRQMLSEWKTMFDRFCTRVKPARNRAMLLLQIQFRTAEMVLRTVVSTRDLPKIEAFEAQVEACEEFLDIHFELQRRENNFFMDHVLIPALFFSATRCPNVQIAKRALRLLRRTSWQEGFWTSRQAAEEAEKLIALQRSSANPSAAMGNNDISRTCRIGSLNRFEGCAWEFLNGHGLVLSKLDT